MAESLGKKNKGILLSCGLGGEEEDMASQAVKEIIKNNDIAPDYLFVEPRLLPKNPPSWIKKADFTNEMFKQIQGSHTISKSPMALMNLNSDKIRQLTKIIAWSRRLQYIGHV